MTVANDGPVTGLRVLHVLAELRPSGAEMMLELAAPLWARHEITPQIVSLAAERGPFAGRLSAAGYKIHVVAPAPKLAMLRAFRDLLANEAIDVVHLHVEGANFWLATIARARGVGVVYTAHAPFSFERALRAERVVQRALGRCMGVRFVSPGASVAANEAERFFNATTIIPNWCDLDSFQPPTEQQRVEARARLGVDGEFVIVSVGNCAGVKNHALILRALSRCGSLDYRYLHAGDHSGPTGADELHLCDSLGLGDRVRFLGAVEDVAGLLHAADAFVMSSHREGFGIAAAEALSCGLPLVLTDVPGLRDIGAFGGDIDYVDMEPASMATAILEVADRVRQRIAPFGNAGFDNTLRATLDPAAGVASYARVYRESTNSRARPRRSGRR